MTTRYRKMQMEGWAVSSGEWEEFTVEDLTERFGARAETVLDSWLNDHQSYVEVFRNGAWRPASIRTLPIWQHASQLEIGRLEYQATQLKAHAGAAYREQAEILEAVLLAVKEAEARAREQRERVAVAEGRLKDDTGKAKKLESEAASKRRDLDRRLEVFDASTSPKAPEAVPA